MPHYLLEYDLAPTYESGRAAHRGVHLRLAWEAADRGELLMGGALSEPFDRAHLVFTSEEAARTFAEHDPYVSHGLVTAWRIRVWNTVVGAMASTPLRP